MQNRLDEEIRADVFADLVAAMDFADLLTVVQKSDKLRVMFGSYSQSRWKAEVCSPVTALRHDVMHTVRALVKDASSSLTRLIDLDATLRGLLAHASAVSKSTDVSKGARGES